MKNRKGFTLIEIIICIGIIAIISLTSIVGFNLISKNIRITKLKEIEDDILTAAKIYLETNDEANANLYQKKNGVILPLTVLVNEGLLDLTTTDLDLNDVSDEYVVTALSNSGGGTDDGCIDLRMVTSWDEESNDPLYICSRADGTISLQGSGGQADNISMVKREIYYPNVSNNYIRFTKSGVDYDYRLYYIDRDDSLVLVKAGKFGEIFKGKTLGISHSNNSFPSRCSNTTTSCSNCYSTHYSATTNNSTIYDYETNVDANDLDRFTGCDNTTIIVSSNGMLSDGALNYNYITKNYYKLRLKPCMKITGGSGDNANPFRLEDKCGE